MDTTIRKSNRRHFNLEDKRCNCILIVITSIVGVLALATVLWAYFAEIDADYQNEAPFLPLPIALLSPEQVKQGNSTSASHRGADNVPWQILNGKWKFLKAENMDYYLYEVGMPWLVAKIAAEVNFYVNIRVNGTSIKIQVESPLSTEPDYDHKVGGEETDLTVMNKEYKATTIWDDDKLIVRTRSSTGDPTVKPQKTTRQIINGQLIGTMEAGDVIARQYFERAESS